MNAKALLRVLPWLAYPLAICFGLQVLQPRYLALVLAATLLLRRRRDARRLLAGLNRAERIVLGAVLGLSALTVATNSETLLRLYPAAMALGMLTLFALSLRRPPSMIERLARLHEPNLPPAGVRYTRRVTQIWCAFFVGNGTVAAYTSVYASREEWALYNGLIAYVLMGALFTGEWLVRRRLFPHRTA
ncbi:MAG: hypothetical protein JSR40_18335 [Proteobacteria bacterium]|nr:hypothetical protein [Pseudomonadota bacterium]